MKNIDERCVNTLRVLSVDAIQKANSGHPGMALGSAPILYTLFTKHMKFSTKHQSWMNRDRFVLSAGHASALQYSLLHLLGYGITMDDLKDFRQFGSNTPGHPEYRDTEGIEATTGPLGAGIATAVGLALGQAHMASIFNKSDKKILNNFTYVLAGDGCLMEGLSSEASSFAGQMKLDKLIILYDSNQITIDGPTDLTFNEDVRKRYESYGFHTYVVEDGNDIDEIDRVISLAKTNQGKPSFIEIKTTIGYGSIVAGTSKAHGAPLGADGVKELKREFGFPEDESFYVETEVYDKFKSVTMENESVYNSWELLMEEYKDKYPKSYEKWNSYFTPISIDDVLSDKEYLQVTKDSQSTRVTSGLMINKLKDKYENFIGGSADLASSNMTDMNDEKILSPDSYEGRNIRYGIREHAMSAIGNGLVLYGGLHSFVATFFVFSDFLKPMARLSAIQKLPLTYVFSHDSIGVGEDGPTHQPIEQLAMLRAMPNMVTIRPADAKETAYAWAYAISSKDKPVSLVLSRQNLPQLDGTGEGTLKGAYIVHDSKDYDCILISTGSELSICFDAMKELEKDGIHVRIVSMPSMELFREQSKDYQESVLPRAFVNRVAIEAAATQPWHEFVGFKGEIIGLDHFGSSSPAPRLFLEFNMTKEAVITNVRKVIGDMNE